MEKVGEAGGTTASKGGHERHAEKELLLHTEKASDDECTKE